MNSIPNVTDRTEAAIGRLLLIPTTRVFTPKEQDAALLDKLRAEMPGIALWAITGAKRLIENGGQFTSVDTALRECTPHLRSLTARPFLPDYFPGYDVYIWIDCDAWVQEQFALEWLFYTAASGALGIVPELDRSYDKTLRLWDAATGAAIPLFATIATP